MRICGVLVAALVVVPAIPTAPAAAAAQGSAYFWSWSDGSRALTRTFADPHSSRVDLPKLVVTSHPARAGHRVLLQFRSDGGWQTEDMDVTGRDGRAQLEVNPYCDDGAWCDAQLHYRLRVDGRDALLTVTFDG